MDETLQVEEEVLLGEKEFEEAIARLKDAYNSVEVSPATKLDALSFVKY